MSIETKTITIPAHDGGSFKCYLAKPEGKGPFPEIIMIQEIFGINQEMRDKCDEYAAKGYVTVCPDLFWRIEPDIELVDSDEAQLQRAFELFGEFDVNLGMHDLETTLGYMRFEKVCNKKVGCIGYCLGGKLAYMMAVATDIDATVSYYGVGIENMLDVAERIEKPTLLHIAENDEFVPADAQEAILSGLASNPHVTMHRYEGVNHAFARGQGMHYDEAQAKLANSRTAEFLEKNLK